ncbi:unnamed protein product, partial [Ectocarpus sp. 12 AP-2014]
LIAICLDIRPSPLVNRTMATPSSNARRNQAKINPAVVFLESSIPDSSDACPHLDSWPCTRSNNFAMHILLTMEQKPPKISINTTPPIMKFRTLPPKESVTSPSSSYSLYSSYSGALRSMQLYPTTPHENV